MNYNIDLPEELKTISKPKFEIGNNKLLIYNRPFWDDWSFMVFAIGAIILFSVGKQIEYRNDYLLLFIAIFLFGLSLFSLNKVVIDFEQKVVTVKNYNFLVNFFRKFFKMPLKLKFDEIEKFYPDVKFGGSKSRTKYFTVLQTDAPYKFTIAIFERESQSIVFTDYLKQVIKHHSIHTAQVSDTTVLN